MRGDLGDGFGVWGCGYVKAGKPGVLQFMDAELDTA